MKRLTDIRYQVLLGFLIIVTAVIEQEVWGTMNVVPTALVYTGLVFSYWFIMLLKWLGKEIWKRDGLFKTVVYFICALITIALWYFVITGIIGAFS